MDKLVRAMVKAAIASLAPVIGAFGVDAAQAVAEAAVDARDKRRSEDIAGRVWRATLASATTAFAAEGVAPEVTAAVGETVRVIAGRTDEFLRGWADAGFDASAAARVAMASHARELSGLSKTERHLCGMLLKALYGALASEAKALEATEAAFRSRVLTGIGSIEGRLGALGEAEHRAFEDAVRAAALSLPTLAWHPDWSPPGALLRADIDDPVPFHGREDELADLVAWCDSRSRLAVRLYTGAGGFGKTRLLRELVRRMRSAGWHAGFVASIADGGPDGLWRAVADGPVRRLYVIDYAENRRGDVARLIRALLTASPEVPRRVVLLARAADEWWDRLRTEAEGVGEILGGPASRVYSLAPLAPTEAFRRESFGIAASHFGRKLARPLPPITDRDLGADEYRSTLLLHMAALASVEGVEVQGDQGILHYVLGRERRFWARHVASVGLPEHLARGIGRAMAVVTLAGGMEDRSATIALLDRIPFFANQPVAVREAIAQLLHETYPGQRWIEPVLPDPLGEQLCQEELEEDQDALLALVFGEAKAS